MKILVTVLMVGLGAPFLSQTAKPIPPGIREADKLPGPADIPPMNQPANRPSPTVMNNQARELAQLAQTIPADVSQIGQGVLPKDMAEKLKRIEKLSKTLRNELSR